MAVFEARQLKPNVGLFNYSLFCIRGRDSLLDAKFTYFVTVEIFFHRGGNSLLGTIGEKNKRDPQSTWLASDEKLLPPALIQYRDCNFIVLKN